MLNSREIKYNISANLKTFLDNSEAMVLKQLLGNIFTSGLNFGKKIIQSIQPKKMLKINGTKYWWVREPGISYLKTYRFSPR